jgi:hypothetical protein
MKTAFIVAALLLARAAAAGDLVPIRPAPAGHALITGEQACLDDYRKLCTAAGVDPGAIHTCFVENRSRVSAACMTVVKAYKLQ